MSDPITDKDPKCDGCVKWGGSYNNYPCNVCSNVFSGMVKNWYQEEVEGNPHWYDEPFENRFQKNKKVDIVFCEEPNDKVKHPQHYMLCDIEAIDIIKKTLTVEQYKGFILGNVMKYRLRAGKKGDGLEDLAKALFYEELWEATYG